MRISDWSSDVCSSDLVVGRDDGIGDQLLAKAASYGIPSNVRFLGSREDVPSLVAGSDIGVLCSHEEGFSNAILEYMQAGLPVVATDVGGNADRKSTRLNSRN